MNERVRDLLNKPWTIPIGVGVVAFGTGFGLGYILAKKQKYQLHAVPEQLQFDLHAEELEEIRLGVDELSKPKKERAVPKVVITDENLIEELVGDDPQPNGSEEPEPEVEGVDAEQIKEAMVAHQIPEPEEDAPDVTTRNIFVDSTDDWDYEEELKKRGPSEPYVLHRDEFWADEMNFTQSTLTYYAGDNIMADEEDSPIYNYETVVGPLKFGHGSGDPNVFHVRNEKRRAEYEILFHEGLYSVDVLGLEIENNERAQDIKHSNNRKFKLE